MLNKRGTLSYGYITPQQVQTSMAKVQTISARTWHKQHHEATFRASYPHATGTYNCKKKTWHDSTQSIDQKSLTDHKPKRIRKFDGTHVNIASYITDSNMAGTTISRHVDELVQLTTEHYMA